MEIRHSKKTTKEYVKYTHAHKHRVIGINKSFQEINSVLNKSLFGMTNYPAIFIKFPQKFLPSKILGRPGTPLLARTTSSCMVCT